MADDEPFGPPSFALPTRRPGPIALWRSIRDPVLGWPPEVYAGGCYRTPVPGAPLIIGDPVLAAEVLTERTDEFVHGPLLNRIFAPIWGRGIFTAEGAEWRWQRRAAAPAFRPARMAVLAPIMRTAAEAALRRWRVGQVIDLQDEMRRLTLQVLFDAALSGGEDFPDREEATREIDAFIAGVGRIVATDVMVMPEHWRPSTERRGGRPAAFMRERVGAMVARRRREDRPRGDLVDLLIAGTDPETGRSMDDELVRDNLMGFLAAGHETTAYALAWSVWIVASHAPTRRRLLAEVEEVAGGGAVGEEHVDRLRFTAQVVREVMRLFPSVGVARAAAAATQVGGHRLRRGAPLLVATYALHRLPTRWERPHLFDPGRFADGAPAGAGLTYLPFGAGPRVCMGAAFAMTELVVALATLVRGAELTPAPSAPVTLGTRLGTVISTSGLRVVPGRLSG